MLRRRGEGIRCEIAVDIDTVASRKVRTAGPV